MEISDGYYTLKGYAQLSDTCMTSAMEDYLEMIARIGADNGSVHVVDLAKLLHVKASSVTKMIRQLVNAGLVDSQKYSAIVLTDKGKEMGDYLLHRHEILHRFLCILNDSDDELEQVEKIEHFIDKRTIKNLESLIQRLQI